jgi:hypothetical protein
VCLGLGDVGLAVKEEQIAIEHDAVEAVVKELNPSLRKVCIEGFALERDGISISPLVLSETPMRSQQNFKYLWLELGI